jgi:hypothetical protein
MKKITWRQIDSRKIIPGEKLLNQIGQIKLSEYGMEGLGIAQKFYGGESQSYVIDRILRSIRVPKVHLPISLPTQVWMRLEEESKKRGYQDAERLIEATLVKLFD